MLFRSPHLGVDRLRGHAADTRKQHKNAGAQRLAGPFDRIFSAGHCRGFLLFREKAVSKSIAVVSIHPHCAPAIYTAADHRLRPFRYLAEFQKTENK